MSTRKRGRSSLNANEDEDELSPSKPTSAPLSAAKKRKLNMYGARKATGVIGRLADVFGFARPEKENINAADGRDELAVEEDPIYIEEDLVEALHDKKMQAETKGRKCGRTPTSAPEEAPQSQRKGGSAMSRSGRARKKDIYDVDSSEEETNIDRTPRIPKSTSKGRDPQEENATAQRGRGRPPKRIDSLVPPPKKSPGNLRARDILKKAKKLSREASFQAMVEAGQKAAAEELEKAQPSRRRSVRVIVEAEAEEGVVEKDAEIVRAARPRGRPKKDTFEGFKNLPRGTVTPSNNRTLKTKKSVAFEGSYDLDLGFKDIPDSANKNQPPKTGRLIKKDVDPIENAPLEEEEDDEEGEDDDDTACAVCNGKDSKKGNEIILCETCDFAVHLKCYDLPKIPKGDWFCRVCQPGDEDLLRLEALEDTARDEPSEIPEIEGLEGHLRRMQTVVLDRLTRQKRIKLQGHDEAMRKVHQVVEQTVLAGEGNSMLVIGARGCGKTTLVESVITDLSIDHRENFHVVRLNGFIYTDDKLALKEIWRQLGREMDAEDEMSGKTNHADTLASLLALLSHPSEISEDRADETAKSVVFILDEFDLFTTHPRQTLLYNLFDIAQAKKAPILVLGVTTRIDVVEALEKRVKSRFSHRYVHLSLPKSCPAFWDICKEGLLVEAEDLQKAGFDLGMPGQKEFVSYWHSMIEDLYNKDAYFKHHLQSFFYRSKSASDFFTSCILPIANLSARSLPLTGRKFATSLSLSAPDSKLHILQGLSDLELALLIAAARLDIILDTDTCNFAMAYDEYSSLTSRHKIQTSSSGINALGASAKVWRREVALEAWERLAEYELLIPAGIGGSARDLGAGRMWKVDVGLEEITGSVEGLSGVMTKWCREI